MADQTAGPNPDQPGRVEVALSFLSGQDSAAFAQMKDAFQQASIMFQAFRSSNFADEAKKLVELTERMNRSQEQVRRMENESRLMQQRGGGLVGRVEDALSGARQRAGRGGATTDPRETAEALREEAAEKAERDQQKERERHDQLTERQREANRLRTTAGMEPLSPGAQGESIPRTGLAGRLPGGWGRQQRDWRMGVDPLRGEDTTSVDIPQFGQLTMQNYFEMMRDRRVNEALRRHGTGDVTGADRMGRRAEGWQSAANTAAAGYAIHSLMRHAQTAMTGQGLNPNEWQTAGARLGYAREGGRMGWDAFGIQTPFNPLSGGLTPAAQEGWRQTQTMYRLRMMPGINREQAQGIVNATSAAGMSGRQGQEVAREFMGPLYQQYQVDPEQLIPFTQVLRTGTGGIEDITRALSGLGETARAARVDVNTMAQGLAQAGEAMQAQGGHFLSGVQFGRQFTNSYGLMPQVGQTLSEQPMTQAILSGRTGLPSFALQAAPAADRMAAIRDSVNMQYRAYRGALGGARQSDVRVRGQVVGQVSGDDPAIAAVAAQNGISADEAEKIIRGEDRATAMSNLETVITGYEQEAERGTADARRWARQRGGTRFNATTGEFERRRGRGRGREATWETDTNLRKRFADDVGIDRLGQMEKDTKGIDREDIIKAAHDAGIKGPALGEALDKKTPEARINAVKTLISERAAEEQAKYQIAFTGPAKRLFKALVNDAGGAGEDFGFAPNKKAASSRGNKPLGPGSGTAGLGGP